MSDIDDFLGVETSERRSVALMVAHSFFMGCATVFFETAASATFLTRFPSAFLPWVYIAAAGANTLTGSVYTRVQQRVSFAQLMKGTLCFLLILVTTVRAGFAVSGAAWAAFAGLVSYRIVSSLTDLEYWAVASRIYDVRQAKRLFGLIGTGEVVARIIGSFSVPLLVSIGGVSNLMVLSACALGLCLVLVSAILRADSSSDAPPSVVMGASSEPVPQRFRDRLGEILSSRYLVLVVIVAILATFGKYFVEFSYLEQMSTLSKGEAQLAGFLGLFNGVTQTLSLLTRLFLSRPILSRFGIRAGVVILPALHAFCAAATIACGLFGAAPPAVFVCVLANQGIYKTFKHPIDNASFKVLYQPLKPKQRLAAQIAVEIVFSPVVVGLAGGVMLLFSAGMRYDPVRFAYVLLVNFVLWIVAARSAGRRYARALVEMIRRRIEGNVVLPFDDATTLSVLRARLESRDPADVCVALDLLEKAGAPDLASALLVRVEHPSPEVRRYAIERLLEIQPAALSAMLPRLSYDPAPTVRGAALTAAATGGGIDAVGLLVRHLDDPDTLVRRAAIAGLVAIGGPEANARAREAVEALAVASDPAERVLAARLAADHHFDAVIVALLADPDPRARRAALVAAGRARAAGTVPILIEHLRDARFAQSAAGALAAHGDAVVEDLEPLLRREGDGLLARRVIYVYRLIGGPAAIAALRRHLDFPDVGVRGRALAALDHLGWSAGDADRDDMRMMLVGEARHAAWALAAAGDLAREPRAGALRLALGAEVDEAKKRALSILALLHDRVTVHRAAHHLVQPSRERRAYALEVLDLLLEPSDRQALMPLLDEAHPDRRARLLDRFPAPSMPARARLRDVLGRPERDLRVWTRAIAVRLARTYDEPALRDAIDRAMASYVRVRELCTPATKEDPTMLLPIERVILLKTVPMFASTADELLAEISQVIEEVDVAAGTTIFAKGDSGESMYIVVSGRVRVFDNETTLSILGEREIFGELALLDPAPRSASVAAVDDTHLFRIEGDVFAQLMEGNLDIVHGVLHVLCDRLRKTSSVASRA